MIISKLEKPGTFGIFGKPGGLYWLVDGFPVGWELSSGGEGNRFVIYWELCGNFRYLVEGRRVFARKLDGNPGLNEAWPKPFCRSDENIPTQFLSSLLERITECERPEFTLIAKEVNLRLQEREQFTPEDLASILPHY